MKKTDLNGKRSCVQQSYINIKLKFEICTANLSFHQFSAKLHGRQTDKTAKSASVSHQLVTFVNP